MNLSLFISEMWLNFIGDEIVGPSERRRLALKTGQSFSANTPPIIANLWRGRLTCQNTDVIWYLMSSDEHFLGPGCKIWAWLPHQSVQTYDDENSLTMIESFLSFDILSGVSIDLLRIILAQLKNVLQILRLNGNNATCSFDFRFSLSLSAAAPLHRSKRVMGDLCFNQS